MKVVVYILCYDAGSEARAREQFGGQPWAHVLRLGPSRYLEGQMYTGVLMDRQAEWQDADFVGTLSWKASEKIDVPDFHSLCSDVAGADVVGLLPLPESPLEQAQVRHPRFKEVWCTLLAQLGYSDDDSASPHIPLFVCNYWLATPHWMRRYCEFYKSAVRVLESHQGVQEALWSHAGYATHLPAETCMQIYGKPYIPHHPFVCERLPCFFFWKQQAVIVLTPQLATKFWQELYGAQKCV